MAPEHEQGVGGLDYDDPPDAGEDPYRFLRFIILAGIACGVVCVGIVVYDALRQREQLVTAVNVETEEEPPAPPVASSNGKGRRRPSPADVEAPAGAEEG